MYRRILLTAPFVFLAAGAHRSARADDLPSFKPEELDQILAPIALYPDALLSQVLMAATYPLEVVEASRWAKANPGLKGDAAVAAVKDKGWDVSVKSLVAFPSVLAQMDEQLEWTQKLGDAMIGQQKDVADSVQRLRARAVDAGTLKTTKEQAVTVDGTGNERIVVVQPADPQIVYVPTYDPNTAYGTWPAPAYPPIRHPMAEALLKGLMFGIGIAAANALFGGWNWGRGGNSYVNVNVNRAVYIDNSIDRTRIGTGGNWTHDPIHRRGVPYRDPATRQRFAAARPGVEQRQQFRGRVENTPAASRQGAQRPALQNRAPAQARDGALSGVDRGKQVNREAARGHAQQQSRTKAAPASPPSAANARTGGRQ